MEETHYTLHKITTLCEFCIKQDDPNVSKLRNNALSSESQRPHGPVWGREKILKNGLSRLSEIFQVCSEIHGPNTIADALQWAFSSVLSFFICVIWLIAYFCKPDLTSIVWLRQRCVSRCYLCSGHRMLGFRGSAPADILSPHQ